MTQDFKTSLPRWKTKIVHLIPIQNGWSVIGRPDKYLSPAACRIADRSDKTIVVELKESGPFLIWSETGAPLTKIAKVSSLGNRLYRIELPETREITTCTLTRE